MKSSIFGSNQLNYFELLTETCFNKHKEQTSVGTCAVIGNNVLKSGTIDPDMFKFFNTIEKDIKDVGNIEYFIGTSNVKSEFFKQKWAPEYQTPATLGSWCVSLEGDITNRDQILGMLTTPASIPKNQIWFPSLIASTLSVFKIHSNKVSVIENSIRTLLDFLQGNFVFSGYDIGTKKCYLYTSGTPMFYNKKSFGPVKFRYWKELDERSLYSCKVTSASSTFKKLKTNKEDV